MVQKNASDPGRLSDQYRLLTGMAWAGDSKLWLSLGTLFFAYLFGVWDEEITIGKCRKLSCFRTTSVSHRPLTCFVTVVQE